MKINLGKCTFKGCSKVACKYTRKKVDGSYYSGWRKFCYQHRAQVYKFPYTKAERIRKLKRKCCEFCGWNKASCDLHRLKRGRAGGKYIKNNVITLCPNCHRIEHDKENKMGWNK